MAALTTFPCSSRQRASPSPVTCSITQALPPATSQTFLSIANTTTGTGYHGMSPQRTRPITTPPLRRHSFLPTCKRLPTSTTLAAEILPRLGPMHGGESGSSVDQAIHFLLH